uniref:Phosphoinositide-3-kinase regulatory subunit 6 n=1 Tax=Sphenodon punctatus TaxID=8508 RepID=A0A8D0GMY4_SPHPU
MSDPTLPREYPRALFCLHHLSLTPVPQFDPCLLAENPPVESDILRSVHALLRELDCHHPAFQNERGMLRWTLHKKTDRNPSSGAVLVKILAKELERAERGDYRHYLLPLLHTLMYTLIKAPCISDELNLRVYDFCKRLLTLPQPYCTIGLDYAVQLKLERTVPGVLYERMVIAEQSLKSDLYPYQEKVFIFADPELLSETVCNALLADIKAAQMNQSPRSCMCHVITRVLQAALGEACDVTCLQTLLQPASWLGWTGLTSPPATPGAALMEPFLFPTAGETASGVQGVSLPSPNISFHLWTDEDQLWKELVFFIRPLSQAYEQDCLSLENFEIVDMVTDCDFCEEQTRFSVLSTDRGIERDLPAKAGDEPLTHYSSGSTEVDPSRLRRKGGIKKRVPPLDSMAFLQSCCNGPGGAKHSGKLWQRPAGGGGSSSTVESPPPAPQRLHTARIVVLGDDRVLGRLAQAFYSLRKRESRRIFLTPRLKLQFYYVPVVEGQPGSSPAGTELCELAGYLGKADPWYQSNINTLCHMIPKLATMPSSPSGNTVSDPFIIDVISYYVRTGLQPVCFQIYTAKVGSWSPPRSLFILLTYNKDKKLNGSFCFGLLQSMTNNIRAHDIKIRSTEQRPLTLCLDKDSRRIYRNVVSVEVSPCLEPSYCLQKTRAMHFSLPEQEDTGLAKYMAKTLLLPINTFAGIVQ